MKTLSNKIQTRSKVFTFLPFYRLYRFNILYYVFLFIYFYHFLGNSNVLNHFLCYTISNA